MVLILPRLLVLPIIMVVRKTGKDRKAGAPFLKNGYYSVEVAKYIIARKASPLGVALID